MSLVNVYGARREAEVMQDTWGHLAPKPGRTYRGWFVFTHGCFGDLTVIDVEFKDLPDSPWFFEHLTDFVIDQDMEPGKVYRFEGTYRSNRRVRFVGKAKPVDLGTAVTGSIPADVKP